MWYSNLESAPHWANEKLWSAGSQQKTPHPQSAVCMLPAFNRNYSWKLVPVKETLWEFRASAHKGQRQNVLGISWWSVLSTTASVSTWISIFILSGTNNFICNKHSGTAKSFLLYHFCNFIAFRCLSSHQFSFSPGYPQREVNSGTAESLESHLGWQLQLC